MKNKKTKTVDSKYKTFSTADGVPLVSLNWADPLFEVKKNENNIYAVHKIVLFSVSRRESLTAEDMRTIFADKAQAEDLSFKNNKLRFETQYPKKTDYKGNYKKALRILAEFSDEQLYEFVFLNYRNDGTGI